MKMDPSYFTVSDEKEKQFMSGLKGITFNEWQLLKARVDETFANQREQMEFDQASYLDVSRQYKRG